MIKPIYVCAVLAFMALPLASNAHHSRSNFLLDQIVNFPATVTRFQYTNPHSFVYVERADGQAAGEEWVIELGSIPNLSRMNMGPDALKPGDQIFVSGNPDRDPAKKYMFLSSITRQDGTRYAMEDVFASGRKAREAGGTLPGSTDLTGIWTISRSTASVLAAEREPIAYEVTPAGQASLDAYNPAEDPFFFCQPMGVPRSIGLVYAHIIEREPGKIHLNHEFLPLQRVVHLDMDHHPEDVEPSIVGHSIGHFEDDTLVVDTARFEPEKWGLVPGLDSSDQKHVIERYRLIDEGHRMSVQATIEDPVYLREPMSVEYTWQHTPTYEVTPYVACDPDAAAKHLQLEGR